MSLNKNTRKTPIREDGTKKEIAHSYKNDGNKNIINKNNTFKSDLSRSFNNEKNSTKFSMSNKNTNDKFVIQSFAQLMDFSQITKVDTIPTKNISLSLYSYTFSNTKWSKLLTVFKFNYYILNSLVFLDLGCCNLTNLHAEQLFFNMDFPNLQVLILAGNLLTSVPYQPNAADIEVNVGQQSLKEVNFNTTNLNRNSQRYSRPNDSLVAKNDTEGASSFILAGKASPFKSKGILSSCPRLQTLILRNNLISEINGFAVQLCIHKNIQELDLSCNSIIDVGKLSYALVLCKEVLKLNLSSSGLNKGNSKPIIDICLFTNIRYLNLWCNEIDEDFALALRDSLLIDDSLLNEYTNHNNLNYSNNFDRHTSDYHIHAPNQSEMRFNTQISKLETLNLGMNKLRDTGAIYISHILREQRAFTPGIPSNEYFDCGINLKHLDLSANEIGSKGGQSIASSLMLNSHLHSLNLSDNYLTFQDCEILIKSSQNHSTLKIINLSRNSYSELEEQHLKKMAIQLAPHVHFKFQSRDTYNDDEKNVIASVDQHINGSGFFINDRPSVIINDTEIDHIVSRSLMETITNELDKKSSITQNLTIPINQNTFPLEPTHESVIEPEKEDNEELKIKKVKKLKENYSTEEINKPSHTEIESNNNKFSSSDELSQLLQQTINQPPLSKSTIRNISQANKEEDRVINPILNSQNQLKNTLDDNDDLDQYLNEIYEQGNLIGYRPQKTNISEFKPTPFSQQRAQFLEISTNIGSSLLDDESPTETNHKDTELNFLGILKRRGILDEAETENTNNDRIDNHSPLFLNQEHLTSYFDPNSAPSSPQFEDSLPQLNEDKSFKSKRQAISGPPDSLVNLLKNASDEKYGIVNAHSPLISQGGKSSYSYPNEFSSQEPSRIQPQREIESNFESTISTHLPSNYSTPLASPTSQKLDSPTYSPINANNENKTNDLSNQHNKIQVKPFHIQAKTFSIEKSKTKKKVDVRITKGGNFVIYKESTPLLGKSKQNILINIQINNNFKVKIIKKGKLCFQVINRPEFIIELAQKDSVDLLKHIEEVKKLINDSQNSQNTIQSVKQVGNPNDPVSNFQNPTPDPIERKLVLDPKSEYVRGVRPFKSDGDNRIDVIVDELYKVEARVNGWLYVSLVRDPIIRGYILPDDVVIENTSQYQFTM